MIRGLFHRAKLLTLISGLVIASVACATTADSEGSEPTATTPAQQTQQPQETNTAEMAAQLAEDALSGELFLNVSSPVENEMFVTSDNVEVSGHTTIDALLSVNDAVLEVDADGKFNYTVQLEEGPNLIEVVASDADGQQRDEVLLVFYEPA